MIYLITLSCTNNKIVVYNISSHTSAFPYSLIWIKHRGINCIRHLPINSPSLIHSNTWNNNKPPSNLPNPSKSPSPKTSETALSPCWTRSNHSTTPSTAGTPTASSCNTSTTPSTKTTSTWTSTTHTKTWMSSISTSTITTYSSPAHITKSPYSISPKISPSLFMDTSPLPSPSPLTPSPPTWFLCRMLSSNTTCACESQLMSIL